MDTQLGKMQVVRIESGGREEQRPGATTISRRGRDAPVGLFIAAVGTASFATFVLWTSASSDARGALLMLSVAAFGAMFARASWRKSLSIRAVLVLSGVLLVAAVIAPPSGTDLWYYQMYGRTFVHYRESAYTHSPDEFRGDEVLARTDHIWTGVRAEYGPVLITVASAIAAATGTNELAARLAWQGLAALAVWIALLLIARRTKDGAAVALVGLNPVVIYSVVNAGHADALVGLAVLVGVLCARDRRDVLAAIALTVAALIKWPAGIGLLAFLVWSVFRYGIRRTLAPAAAAAGTAIVEVTIFGGSAVLAPALAARSRTNGVSPWNVVREHGLDTFRAVLSPLGRLPDFAPTAAVIVALAVVACVCFAHLRDEEPSLIVGSAIVAWEVTALYTSPWSVFWALPVLALHRRALITRVTAAWFCLLLLQQYYSDVSAASRVFVEPHLTAYTHVNAVLISMSIVAAVAIAIALASQAFTRISDRTGVAERTA